jgi:hypothetical protein
MISYSISGDTRKTDKFLDAMVKGDLSSNLDRLAQRGVDALKQHTPRESGVTSDSWTYEIDKSRGSTTIWWVNTHVVNGFNVAIGLQYGHGTGTGGWVEGEDYINRALKPIMNDIANQVWEEVRNA